MVFGYVIWHPEAKMLIVEDLPSGGYPCTSSTLVTNSDVRLVCRSTKEKAEEYAETLPSHMGDGWVAKAVGLIE